MTRTAIPTEVDTEFNCPILLATKGNGCPKGYLR